MAGEQSNPTWANARSLQLAVIEIQGAWRILLNGERIGRFARRADAMECALDISEEARGEGHAVELLSQDSFGEVRSL